MGFFEEQPGQHTSCKKKNNWKNFVNITQCTSIVEDILRKRYYFAVFIIAEPN